MPNDDPELLGHLAAMAGKIVRYQMSKNKGEGVELQRLESEKVLSSEELQFLTSHGVSYTPEDVGRFNGGMFRIGDERCCFYGPVSEISYQKTFSLQEVLDKIKPILGTRKRGAFMMLSIGTSQHQIAILDDTVDVTLQGGAWETALECVKGVLATKGFQVGMQHANSVLLPALSLDQMMVCLRLILEALREPDDACVTISASL